MAKNETKQMNQQIVNNIFDWYSALDGSMTEQINKSSRLNNDTYLNTSDQIRSVQQNQTTELKVMEQILKNLKSGMETEYLMFIIFAGLLITITILLLIISIVISRMLLSRVKNNFPNDYQMKPADKGDANYDMIIGNNYKL